MRKKQNLITGYNVQTTHSETRPNKTVKTTFIVTTIDAMTKKILKKRIMSLKEIHHEQTIRCAIYRIDKAIEKMIPETFTNIIKREEKRVQERIKKIEEIELIKARQNY